MELANEGARIVAKALRLLRVFSAETPVLTAVELSGRSGLSLSAVYRFLATFREHRLVEVDGAGGFRPGMGLLELAAPLLNALDVRRACLPSLQDLSSATGATAFLTLRRGDRAVCVEKVESDFGVRVSPEVGGSRPLHAGAPAKILLAFMPPEARDAYLTGSLERTTRHTLVDPSALAIHLRRIRSAGYAISQGEFLVGCRAVAVPVRDRYGDVFASLSIAATNEQLPLVRARALVPALAVQAERASSTLGYLPGSAGPPAPWAGPTPATMVPALSSRPARSPSAAAPRPRHLAEARRARTTS